MSFTTQNVDGMDVDDEDNRVDGKEHNRNNDREDDREDDENEMNRHLID